MSTFLWTLPFIQAPRRYRWRTHFLPARLYSPPEALAGRKVIHRIIYIWFLLCVFVLPLTLPDNSYFSPRLPRNLMIDWLYIVVFNISVRRLCLRLNSVKGEESTTDTMIMKNNHTKPITWISSFGVPMRTCSALVQKFLTIFDNFVFFIFLSFFSSLIKYIKTLAIWHYEINPVIHRFPLKVLISPGITLLLLTRVCTQWRWIIIC